MTVTSILKEDRARIQVELGLCNKSCVAIWKQIEVEDKHYDEDDAINNVTSQLKNLKSSKRETDDNADKDGMNSNEYDQISKSTSSTQTDMKNRVYDSSNRRDGDAGYNEKRKLTPKSESDKNNEMCCHRMWSCRWILAYLCFLVRFTTGAFRQSMSIAILSMVHSRNVSTMYYDNGTHFENVTIMEREFEWSATFQGFILTTFNAGSIMAPLLVGCLTRTTSERFIILVCLLVAALSSVLLPPFAKINDYTIFLTRGLMGLSLAGTDNVIQSMWSYWAPAKERASLSSFAYAGISVSGFFTYPLCGFLISLGGNNDGWPSIYYTFGTFTMLLIALWWFNAFDTPKKHPRITKEELELITEELVHHDKEMNDELPWKSFLKSPPVWAIFVCYFGNKLVFSLLLTLLPFYFHRHLNADVEETGLLAALPHIGRFASGILGGYASDWMLTKGISIVTTRKTFQSIACFGCAACTIVLTFIDHQNTVLAVTMLVLSMSFQNVASVAYRINVLDIAPRYAGFLGGLIGTVTNVLAVPIPVVVSMFLLDPENISGWPTVFLTVAIVNVIAGLSFLLFAAGEVQHWAHAGYKQIP